MTHVITGLEKLCLDQEWQKKIKGNIALLCHSASVDKNYNFAVPLLQNIFKKRLIKLFGPQHGLVTDVQDNMIETEDFIHPHFNLPVFSLYSKTRIPTDHMLKDVDTVIVDLQDVGTRVYTYISTMTLLMEKCAELDINVVILDRPNPVGGEIIEGNILEKEFSSFVGRHTIPMRHSLTMGEMALYAKKYEKCNCNLEIIPMENWSRSQFFKDTGLPWVLPSPNLPTSDGALTFAGTVIFEGTNISEGRGTTRALELIGHPEIEPFSFCQEFENEITQYKLEGFKLRPIIFNPTFQKHAGTSCGGLQIHITDYKKIRPWKLSQLLCQKLYKKLEASFNWKQPPYEYEFKKLPIDLINGTSKIREWIESDGSFDELKKIENSSISNFKEKIDSIKIY